MYCFDMKFISIEPPEEQKIVIPEKPIKKIKQKTTKKIFHEITELLMTPSNNYPLWDSKPLYNHYPGLLPGSSHKGHTEINYIQHSFLKEDAYTIYNIF